jgi:AraC-like DNA-binding protein
VPRIAFTDALRSAELSAVRAVCDGCDAPHPPEETCNAVRLWLVAEGAFVLRDRHGAHVLDPTTALVLPPHTPFTIHHPHGGDICISLRGPLVDALGDRASRALPIEPATHAALLAAVAAWRRGDDAELDIADVISRLDVRRTPRVDRKLARDIAAFVRLSFAEHISLGDIAANANTSVFHACRVFRATTGSTIHAYRTEVRLRHALAMLVDGDASLADIALACGFASQSHLTNAFRARFATTPGAVRRVRRLSFTRPERGSTRTRRPPRGATSRSR